MKITEIKKIGTGKRYKVEIDGESIGIFEDEILAKYKLRTGQELDENLLKEIQNDNSKKSSFDIAITYLEKFSKTEKGIKDYLKKKGFDEISIEQTISKLNEYGYLNDSVFAENYVKTYMYKKGKKSLEFELKQKGVKEDIISNALEIISEDEERKNAVQLAKKYLKNKVFDQKNMQKCKNYLYSKGFSVDVCNFAVDKIQGENDEDWV